MGPEHAIVAVLFATLVLYALTGGADFGSGVWDLFARGPRAQKQRDLIAHAIGPIWEANHVWLILVIVLLFVCFPSVYATISTALHIPLSLMLFGIVLRGSAFVFRKYDARHNYTLWSRVFSISSVFTPVMFGICTGAITSGTIIVGPAGVETDFFSSWLAPFPVLVGLFTLVQFAFLAAVYLAVEARDPYLREDFRRRGIVSALLLAMLGWAAIAAAQSGAPVIFEGLTSLWAIPLQLAIGGAAWGCLHSLRFHNVRRARVLAVVQTVLVVGGWALAQYPHLVVPSLTVESTHAPDVVLWTVLGALVIGGMFLVPAYAWLMVVFREPERVVD